jgi:hypothetical protein
MAEFEDRQAALARTRLQRSATERELFAARESRRRLQRASAKLARRGGDETTDARIAQLAREDAELGKRIGGLRDRAAEHARLEGSERIAFEPFSDPTKNVARLRDEFPILLFPVRLETRFKRIERDNAVLDQLWVRVYPDDIAVDTFEETLAETEIKNARIYWTNIWKAAGVDGEKRAAWQSLVKSHGSGRAFWIIGQFEPTNLAEEPAKAAGQLILVVVTNEPLPPAEKPAVRAYWRDVWLANNDRAQLDAAFEQVADDLGEARAEVIRAEYAPQNLADRPAGVEEPRVEFLELPSDEDIETQQQPWMHAAQTALLPDRFVLLGFNGRDETLRAIGNPIPSKLVIGPDPTAEPDAQIHLDGDDLIVPEAMKWLVDFDAAVDNGMGFRVDLPAVQARRGFDRLFVLGVRVSADIEQSTADLETLIAHHQQSRKGFSILRQGAPTNNVEDEVSGYTWRPDSDQSYDHYFGQDPADDPADWRVKKDGRWLAELLGVRADLLKASPNYYGTDQCEARAMHIALWPATLGAFMAQSMEPMFGDDDVAVTRDFFTRYVLGRGAAPAVRVGNQPYGILPATPFSRIAWLRRPLSDDVLRPPTQFPFLSRLYALILKADEAWSGLLANVSHVGKPGKDPQQVLLDVVGLHPATVELYQRYAETLEQLYNRLKYTSHLGAFAASLTAFFYVFSGTELLRALGYDARESGVPEILNKFFLRAANLLKGPVIDDRALSETEAIRAYRADGTNYIEWLIAAAKDSHDTLRMQQGFIDDRPPTALLYLMLQHALDASFVQTSLQLHLEAGVFTREQLVAARRQPNFVHIQEAQQDAGSHYQYLYKSDAQITGSPTLTIAEFIPRLLASAQPPSQLSSQLAALEHLQHVPTARLERAFMEHIDCCTYRLDAWWLGLVNVQLDLMRNTAMGEPEQVRGGSYLGAYGWVEDVRSENKVLEPVELDEELDPIFNKPGETRVLRDSENFGYIHAPSLNHAVTAAVLRNGYLANATPQNPESLSINLTSERVRLAMGVIEGIRNGQSLAALLGYHLERGLHDQQDLFLDSLIFELRLAFPLAGNRLQSTQTQEDVGIEAIEARNVVDGLALIEHVQRQTVPDRSYPFGLGSKLPEVTEAAKLDAINAQVLRIMSINDAVADLAMAESVFQVVQGNYDRAAGTLEAFSKGNFPPTPEVVQTPRSGVVLTHRVGLQLQSGLDPADPANTSPRSVGEPSINAWLRKLLPDPADVFCEVEFFDSGSNALQTEDVTAADLELLPIDLLYVVNLDGDQQMRALDDRILFHVVDTFSPKVDVRIGVNYRVKKDDMVSFFELAPLVRSLRALLLRSRPLRATDVRLPNEATDPEDRVAAIDERKISLVRDLLAPIATTLDTLRTDLDTLLAEEDPDLLAANVIDEIDELISRYMSSADAVSRFGLPSAAVAFAHDWRGQQLGALIRKLDEIVERWERKLDDFDQLIAEYPTLDPATPAARKFDHLHAAARSIRTAPVSPLPADPDTLRDDLNTIERNAFVTVLGTLQGLLANATEISALYAGMSAEAANLANHDTQPIDLKDNKSAIVAFGRELHAKVDSLDKDVAARIAKAEELLAGDPEHDAAERIEALTQAARQLLGEEFVVLPEFEVTDEQRAEWRKAHDGRDELLAFLEDTEHVDFPVDEWLYGAARVRDKLHHLEAATMLGNALKDEDIDLVPLQFPYRSDDCWLGLKFPEKKPGTEEPFVIDEDKLLYTAHYDGGFVDAPGSKYCGVLIDEWTEVIPRVVETTGLTFHYDRPSTEPPQTLLLVTPASFTGEWQWQDLVDTLHDTLDLAKKRAVEPEHVNTTAYARFLPVILSQVATFPISPTLNFAFNNSIQFAIRQ